MDKWRRQSFWAAGVVLGAALAGLQGCTQVACDGRKYEPKAGAPVINNITLTQPLVKDPWQVAMAIDFSDSGADLYDGYAFLYINGIGPPKSFPLAGYFETSEVDKSATEGTFGLYFPLTVDQIPDGSIWLLETQLEDASKPDPDGLRSNCYQMKLYFDVSPAPTSTPTAGFFRAVPQNIARLWRHVSGWIGEVRAS